MKKLFVLVALLATLAMATVAGAQAPTSYDVGIQIANLSTSNSANVVVQFYELDTATAAATVSLDPIAAGSSVTLFPLGDAPTSLPDGFNGSAVIQSDQPVAAIANVLGDGFDFGSSYGSFDSGAEVVSLPLIAKSQVGIYSTFVNVQNTGSSDATVTIEYAGTSCTDSATIPAGAAHQFDQEADTCLSSGFVGAATVTAGSGQTIVATVIETSNNNTGLFAYNGFTGGASSISAPLVQFNNVGFHSGFQIQNTGSTATDVTVDFTPAGGVGTACSETISITGGASATFGLGSLSGVGAAGTHDCNTGEQFVGSATVSANSEGHGLVGIINQTNFSNYGSAYGAFDPSTATNTVSMPLLMDRNGGFYTGFNIQNVDTGSVDVTCDFSDSVASTGTIASDSQTLASGEAWNALQLNQATVAPYVGSATCTADGPIIAVVNELGNSTSADLLFTYEAFNN